MSNTLTLQFKQKHMGYCANFMRNVVMNQYFYLASSVRTALKSGSFGPDDLLTIVIVDADLITLYQQLGENQEKMASSVNGDMKSLLLPQLTAIAGGTSSEAATAAGVLQQLSGLDTANQSAVQTMINNGIAWLTQ